MARGRVEGEVMQKHDLRRLPALPNISDLQAKTDAQLTVRLLTLSDLPALEHTHEQTRQLLPKGVVAHDDTAYLTERIAGNGLGLGFLQGGYVIAYALLGLPMAAGGELGLMVNDADLHGRSVAELDGVGVLPEWQGNRLHQRMLAWRIAAATTLDRRDTLATVSPDNRFSLPNMLRVGLRARALIQMPHGAWRYVMHRNEDQQEINADPIWLPVSDYAAQQEHFARGFHGVAVRTAPHGFEMQLIQPSQG